ncbi:hypothetical protein V1525DRAFT_398011 [Lipomyces kononenkoae]|uniref:Uncharacterized protein n=1 Tax=Lipomyces kononenkoae TaxID=34357 RepID=A0ACC3T644_LIPKO
MGLVRHPVNLYRLSTPPPPPSRRCASSLTGPRRRRRRTQTTARGDCQPGHESGVNVDEINNANNRAPCLDLARWAYSRHCEDYFHMPHSTTPLAPRTSGSQSPRPATQIDAFSAGRNLVRDVILRMGALRVPLLITVVGILYSAWTTQSLRYVEQTGWDKWTGWHCWIGVYLFGSAIGLVYAVLRKSMILVGSNRERNFRMGGLNHDPLMDLSRI